MNISRRSLIAAPAVIRTPGLLMPIKPHWIISMPPLDDPSWQVWVLGRDLLKEIGSCRT